VATAVVRREAFDLVGGYSRDMVYGFEDWDFWLALLAVGYHGRLVPERLFQYRKHPAGRSMLSETQRHRAEMIHRMIEHHRSLFAAMLECSMADKDSMFFTAHMEAWQLRERLAERSAIGGGPGPQDDELYQTLMAQAELDYIENSRTWKAVQRFKASALYRGVARLRFGREWNRAGEGENARTRLARIKRSRFYRAIQMMKRTALYRWYARRKYGESFASFPGRLGSGSSEDRTAA
jgi:hypothetical protein